MKFPDIKYVVRTKILTFYFLLLIVLSIFNSAIPLVGVLYKSNIQENTSYYKNNVATQNKLSLNNIRMTVSSNNGVVGSGSSLHVSNSLLYLVELHYGLEIYNISNVKKPKLINSFQNLSLRYENKMIISENYIYIYNNHDDFYILDYTNPSSITERAHYLIYGVINFAINDSYLYALKENGLAIYDIENFSTLELIGEYSNSSANYRDFALKNNFAYICDEEKGFSILNITDYTNISLVKDYVLNESNYFPSIYIDGNNLYIDENSKGLHVYNITNPLAAYSISLFDELNDDFSSNIFVVENIIYLLRYKGFSILDASDLTSIQLISNFQTDPHGLFSAFEIQDNYIYLHSTETGHFESRKPLHIVNVTNLELPVEVYPKLGNWDSTDFLLLLLYIFLGAIVVAPVLLFLIAVVRSLIKDIKR
ncbi:MAG: hypothetical protein HZR80_08600 [Candidatus Heimdallarchaeota archaeon]